VHGGNAKDGHDSVADELFDGAAVSLEHLARDREVALHDTSQRFAIEPFTEGGRARDVAEEDRHHLAQLARFRPREGSSTRVAEARLVPVLPAARGADGHGRSVRRYGPTMMLGAAKRSQPSTR